VLNQRVMGSAGHAFIAHTKALSPLAQCKDGGYGPPPHPKTVRIGQRYWPRIGTSRDLLVVRRLDSDRAVVGTLRDRRSVRRIAVSRLLEVREDSQGRYYQFQGFSPRRYTTGAYVRAIQGGEAELCVPEWHPGRAVRVPARLLPAAAQVPGAWLCADCDLSASSAARLQLDPRCALPGEFREQGDHEEPRVQPDEHEAPHDEG
jgi:hypothetical protein